MKTDKNKLYSLVYYVWAKKKKRKEKPSQVVLALNAMSTTM